MRREERERRRITIPGVIKRLEEQLGGEVTRKDFFPIPSVCGLTDFMEQLTGERKYRLSTHFACGMATYLLKDNGRVLPITRFLDVGGLLNSLHAIAREKKSDRTGRASGMISAARLLWNIKKYVHRTPNGLDITKVFMRSLTHGSYNAFLDFHENSLFIGMMHFQDPYNYDLERVRKCSIHYVTPDGRIIPFCAFNVLPELYRDKVQGKFSIPQREWEEKTGRRLEEDKYRQSLSRRERKRIMEFYRHSSGEWVV